MKQELHVPKFDIRPSFLREDVIQMSHRSGGAHLASSLSSADIVATLYSKVLRVDPRVPTHPDRDRFILSKGHAAALLYSALARRGFFPLSELEGYGTNGSVFAEHPLAGMVPGVEAATGSLGHGLPMGVGIALAGRINAANFRVFVLTSDGENNEGSLWEAAMFAAAQQLERLCVIVDYNKWQATGRSDEVLALSPLAAKWRAFGWRTHELDGHDCGALSEAFRIFESTTGAPTVIIAHTVKGKGVSFMEDDNNWHYRIPDAAEVDAALKELGAL
ncbi:transketolase [Candidatus Nanopelagicales bacterium]|nr:transketolase [Candidatus Nanopelagicales bacterium]